MTPSHLFQMIVAAGAGAVVVLAMLGALALVAFVVLGILRNATRKG